MFVSTKYDYEINQRVFYVRDSEWYTKSTSILVEVPDGRKIGTSCILKVTVEGFEGVGTVEYYLNDVLVDRKTIKSSILTFDYVPTLSQDIITIKFLGNDKCLASKEVRTIWNEEHEPYETTLNVSDDGEMEVTTNHQGLDMYIDEDTSDFSAEYEEAEIRSIGINEDSDLEMEEYDDS